MKKIKESIIENWKHYIAILLVSVSIVCILVDIVQIFNIINFYLPYILTVPVLLAVVLKLLCIQGESQKELSGLYYALILASVEYLILVLIDVMFLPSKLKVVIYMITVLYMLIYSKIKGIKANVAESKDDEQDGKKKIFSLYYINTEKVYEIAMLLNNRIITGGTKENELESTIEKQANIGINSNLNFSVKISIPLENTGVSSVFATSVWPFSLIFSLARRNEGNFFQAVPTTLSSSLAEVRLASLVAWA